MNEEISDYRLQGYYKRKLNLPQYYYARVLKAQRNCGARVIHFPQTTPAVFVVSNGEQSKILGAQFCDSSWSCPVCSSREMARYASRIATAIDALYEQFDELGFMMTFTVPHHHNWSCQQVYDILREAWKNFVKNANAKKRPNDVFGRFCKEFSCYHRIKVGEFTWGYYGWHPHYHCLFFVDKNRLNEVKSWQQEISDRWFTLAKKATIKILKRDNFCENVEQMVNDYYDSKKSKIQQTKEAVISLNDDGTVRAAKSSEYICGWGADKELTGNIRKQASHKGHFTPHQLLKKAYELDNDGKTTNNERADRYFRRYVEYAIATKGTYRVKMSSSLTKIIDEWQATHANIQTQKKISEDTTPKTFHLVVWFTKEQWCKIYFLEIIDEILSLAKEINGKKLIEQLLLKYHIDITKNGRYPSTKFLPKCYQELTATDISDYNIA